MLPFPHEAFFKVPASVRKVLRLVCLPSGTVRYQSTNLSMCKLRILHLVSIPMPPHSVRHPLAQAPRWQASRRSAHLSA